MRYPPAVVLPMDAPAALGIARSLGRRGISVYGVDPEPSAIGMYSRYVRACPFPNPGLSDQDRVRFLLDLGGKLGEKAVLYPVSDDNVLLCSKYRSELAEYYYFVIPDHQTVSCLLTKDGLHNIARSCDIPDPQSFEVKSLSEVEKAACQLSFPVILKPVFSPSWLRPEIVSLLRDHPLSGPPKVALCRNAGELFETYSQIAVYDSRIIVQEVIPGEDERLVYFCFYLDRQSQPQAVFAGRKLRVLPVGFGSATLVSSFHDPELEEISFKLLNGSHYQGLGGIEFKKDPRDNRYKLIEFNARLGMWDSFGARCGIDIPYISYCDALGWPIEPQGEYRDGVLWVDFQRDVRAFLIYRSRGKLSFGNWLQSLRGEKEWAIYSEDDWKPALVASAKMFERPWQAVKARLPYIHNS